MKRKHLAVGLSICLAVLTLFSFASCGGDKFIKLSNWIQSANLPNLIVVEYKDEDVVCKISAEKGRLNFLVGDKKSASAIEAEVNQVVTWIARTDEDEVVDNDYITVLLCKESKVIGYAVIKAQDREYRNDHYPKILKQKIFRSPKSESETKKTIKRIIERDKGRWI